MFISNITDTMGASQVVSSLCLAPFNGHTLLKSTKCLWSSPTALPYPDLPTLSLFTGLPRDLLQARLILPQGLCMDCTPSGTFFLYIKTIHISLSPLFLLHCHPQVSPFLTPSPSHYPLLLSPWHLSPIV